MLGHVSCPAGESVLGHYLGWPFAGDQDCCAYNAYSETKFGEADKLLTLAETDAGSTVVYGDKTVVMVSLLGNDMMQSQKCEMDHDEMIRRMTGALTQLRKNAKK